MVDATRPRRFRRYEPFLFFTILAVATGFAAWNVFDRRERERVADPESPEQVLLDRGIASLWGARDPGTLKALRTSSSFEKDGSTYRLDTYIDIASRYREVRSAYGIVEEYTLVDDEVFATVDGASVPVSDAEALRIRQQPDLFLVSQLHPLKDGRRFTLEHLGESRLEDGTLVERLRVAPRSTDHEFIFDFETEGWTLRRVTLDDGETERMLVLSDYRDVDGLRTAFRLESRQDGETFATQTVKRMTLGDPMPDEAFVRPEPPAEVVIVDKTTVAGQVAIAAHDGDRTNVEAAVDKLKVWIAEARFAAVGPLVVVEMPPADGADEPTFEVCIPVASADAEAALPEPDPVRGLRMEVWPMRRALAAVLGDDDDQEEVIVSVRNRAAALGLTPVGAPLEIYFSVDGSTRQIQQPVE